MNMPNTSKLEGAKFFKTSMAVYATCYSLGKVAVRVLGDPSGVAGSWVDRAPVTDNWAETAALMIQEWEGNVRVLERYVADERDRVWVSALKRGSMILDYNLNGRWYATIFQPLETV